MRYLHSFIHSDAFLTFLHCVYHRDCFDTLICSSRSLLVIIQHCSITCLDPLPASSNRMDLLNQAFGLWGMVSDFEATAVSAVGSRWCGSDRDEHVIWFEQLCFCNSTLKSRVNISLAKVCLGRTKG